MKLHQSNSVFIVFISCSFILSTRIFVQGSNVEICDDVHPPDIIENADDNCWLVCNVHFHHAVTNTKSEELALCLRNTSIGVLCKTHSDCRQYHVGAYCKWIPCLCKTSTGKYILNPHSQVPNLNTCIVSSKYVNPDLPLVPFPWKTLLIVCGIVFAFALFLICVRWISPFIQSIKAKRSARNRNTDRNTQEDDNTLFPQGSQQAESSPFTYYFAQGMPRIYRAGPRRNFRNPRTTTRIQYTTCSQTDRNNMSNYVGNQDKPPPYETAIQMPPPAYDDVEGAADGRSNVQLNISQPTSVAYTVTPNS